MPIVVTTTYLDIPPDHIAQKFRTFIATAKKQGAAVAAAHISTRAPEVVRSMLPEFRCAGIVFVPIAEFLARRPRDLNAARSIPDFDLARSDSWPRGWSWTR